jgi:hypothetical protein
VPCRIFLGLCWDLKHVTLAVALGWEVELAMVQAWRRSAQVMSSGGTGTADDMGSPMTVDGWIVTFGIGCTPMGNSHVNGSTRGDSVMGMCGYCQGNITRGVYGTMGYPILTICLRDYLTHMDTVLVSLCHMSYCHSRIIVHMDADYNL